MNAIKTILSAFVLIVGSTAHSDTITCSSVGHGLPLHRLEVEVKLERTFTGEARQGSYTYKGTGGSTEKGEGEFACMRPKDNGVVFCGVTISDKNIDRIVAHSAYGLMFKLSGEDNITLFNCK